MDFVCIGNVNKGLSDHEIRSLLHIPEDVIFSVGPPKSHNQLSKNEIYFSVYWGIYVPAGLSACCHENTGFIRPDKTLKIFLISFLMMLAVAVILSFNWWQWLIILISNGLIGLLIWCKKLRNIKIAQDPEVI